MTKSYPSGALADVKLSFSTPDVRYMLAAIPVTEIEFS